MAPVLALELTGHYLAIGFVMAIVLYGLYDFPLLTLRELDRAGQKVSFTEVLIVLGLSSMSMAVLMVEGLLPSSFCAPCKPLNCA